MIQKQWQSSMLMQGINLPTPSTCSTTCFLPLKQYLTTPLHTLGDLHVYTDGRDTQTDIRLQTDLREYDITN